MPSRCAAAATFKVGVIDPTKVVRSALQNAASVASLVLTTECMVAEQAGRNGALGAGSSTV